MTKLRLLWAALFAVVLILSCSKDEATNTTTNTPNQNHTKRTSGDRTFLAEDLLIPPAQEELDYVSGIKAEVLADNTFLLDLVSVPGFGDLMWDAPKIFRNDDLGVVYSFIPVFDPTLYQVSHFFGVRDEDGAFTYWLASKNNIREAVSEGNLTHKVINAVNLLEYFDYNFGFLDVPNYQEHSDGDGGIDEGQESSGFLDCFGTTYWNSVLCQCGGDHPLSQIGQCICNDENDDGTLKNSCSCPYESSSTFLDCFQGASGYTGNDGGSVSNNTGGNTGSTFSSNTALNNLMGYVDNNSKAIILELEDTQCEVQLNAFNSQIIGNEQNSSLISKINCLIQNLEVLPGGGCGLSISDNFSNFSFVDLDDDLQAWILSATSAPDAVLNNPVCDMIEAGYTAEEVNAYLAFLKPALENEPDPGYNGGEPDPYSAYNITTDISKANKVTQFFIDYPCVGVGDNLGLLLSEPEVVDWAIGFLDGDCGSVAKSYYVNVIFEAAKKDLAVITNYSAEKEMILLNFINNYSSSLDADVTEMLSLSVHVNSAMLTEVLELVKVDATTEGVLAGSMTFAAQNNSSLEGPYDNNHHTAINKYAEANITDPALLAIWAKYFSANCAILKQENPEWSNFTVYWHASLEMIHIGLDLAGLVPGIGEVFDVANGIIYTIEGDGVNAALSYASAIPVIGWYAAGGRLGKKILTLASGSKTTLKWVVKANDVINFGKGSQLRKVLGITSSTQQAHHISPWALREHDIVQAAAKSGIPFHMNEAINGIAVASWRNQPNHNLYNDRFLARLDAISNEFPNITNGEALAKLKDLLDEVKGLIVSNPNSHLNDIIF